MKFPLSYNGVIRGKSLLHSGVDFGWHQTHNCPVYSIWSGVVTEVTVQPKGGNVIKIKHDITYKGKAVTSEYAHLQDGSIKVKVGQKIKVYQHIANMGKTGKVSGEHLHLNVRIGGKLVDPLKYLCLYDDQKASKGTIDKYKIFKTKKVVKCNELNIRNQPNTKGKVVGTAKKGEQVESFGLKNKWNIVDNIREYYCSNNYLK